MGIFFCIFGALMILPSEIRKVSFKKSGVLSSGYDTEEVRAFLSSLANEWEEILSLHENLKADLDVAHKQIVKLKEREAALNAALIEAEENTFSSKNKVDQEAIDLIKKAEKRATELTEKAEIEKLTLDKEIQLLITRKNDIVLQIKSFLNQNLEKLTSFEQEFNPEQVQAAVIVSQSFFETNIQSNPLPKALKNLFLEKL